MRTTQYPGLLFFIALSLAASGCSLKKITVDQTAAVLADAGRAFTEETDLELAELAIPASIKTAEGFLYAHPEQPTLLRIVAEGYVSYAVGFFEDQAEAAQEDDPDHAAHLRRRARDFHRRGRDYGMRLLKIQVPELAAALEARQRPSPELLAQVGEDELPGLFWTGMGWMAFINQSKMYPEEIVHLSLVKTLLERAVEIDPGFFHGGALMTLAAVDAGVPMAMGGDPVGATEKFKRVIELNQGRHLMSKVLYGKMVGLQRGDKELYVSIMKEVLAADPDADPSLALLNRLAQRRARRYLAEADDLFI